MKILSVIGWFMLSVLVPVTAMAVPCATQYKNVLAETATESGYILQNQDYYCSNEKNREWLDGIAADLKEREKNPSHALRGATPDEKPPRVLAPAPAVAEPPPVSETKIDPSLNCHINLPGLATAIKAKSAADCRNQS